MSTLAVATVKSLSGNPTQFQNSSGNEVGQLAKAWVNFQGTGTVSIHQSFNVSSITDSAEGKYIVNMSITMANGNYVPLVGGIFDTNDGDGTTICSNRRISLTTTTFGIRGNAQGSELNDLGVAWAAVFGD